MNILVLGSGGREHALAWAIAKSPKTQNLFVVPGNPGMEEDPGITTHNIDLSDFEKILKFSREQSVDLVVVGPETPLVAGISDYLIEANIPVVGPSKSASMLESSKDFAKKLMQKCSIPTAEFKTFQDYDLALEFISTCSWDGIVVKADELHGGKGVIVTSTKDEAKSALYDIMKNPKHTVKSQKVVLEEKLVGKEVSAFILSDGKNFINLGYACDHKRLKDFDQGPNTGGMGTYSPISWPDDQTKKMIEEDVFQKIIDQMSADGTPFAGILFAGLMITSIGPYVIEFNVRLGDPEAQVLLPILDEDIVPLLYGAACGNLDPNKRNVSQKNMAAVHVVMAAQGYPGVDGTPIRKGDSINICESINQQDNLKLYFAGVAKTDGKLVTNGGRVLGLTALGSSKSDARNNVYKWINEVNFEGAQIRNDIAR